MPENPTITLYVGGDEAKAIVETADRILTGRGDSLSAAFRRMCATVVEEEIDNELSLHPQSKSEISSYQLQLELE